MIRTTLFTKNNFSVFVIFVFLFNQYSISQTTDSTSIASFFNLINLSNINDNSKDSIYELTGNDERLQDTYHYFNARILLQTGKLDEAKKLAKSRINVLPKSLGKFQKAKYYNIIGSVHANTQQAEEAISYFKKALRLSEKFHQDVYAAKMENNITNIYFSLVDYESAYIHITRGYDLIKDYPDHPFYSSLLAVLSISEAKVGKMKQAKEHGQIALISAKKQNDLIAIIITNLVLGEVANSENNYQEAKYYLSSSLELSEKYGQKQYIELNSIGLMVANLGTNDFANAVKYGETAHDLVNQGGDQTTLYSIKKNLAAAYFGNNQAEKSYELMFESHEIFRETNSIENKKAINDILIKYDAEKNKRKLVSKDNEILQKKIERNKLIQLVGALVILIAALGLIIGYIRYRNKTRIEKINTEQESKIKQAVFDGEELERERIARELHDGVASNLTAARYQLMANNDLSLDDKNQLGGILLKAHEDTRRLSHNLAPFSLEKFGLEKALEQFAKENSNDNCLVVSALVPSGSEVPKDKASILYRVAQELTQNAIKHAEASEISIQVIFGDELSLIVEDDGKGFDFSQVKDSNGMSSIAKRAEQLHGTFEIDSNPNHGTIVSFTIS